MAEHEKPYDIAAAKWNKGDASATILDEQELCRPTAKSKELTWVNVVSHRKAESSSLLMERFGFHELEVEDALTAGERPHLHDNEDHLFLTVPAVRLDGPKVYYTEVGLFVSSCLVVTVSTERVEIVDAWFERWSSKAPTVAQSASHLLYALLDAIIDDYYPVIDAFEATADGLEGEIFKGRPVQIKDLLRLKRRLLEMRRRLSPFRDILNGLLRRDVSLVPAGDKPYFQDVFDHTLRILENVDLNRDIMASILDAHLANVSNRLNDTMRALTVIATLLMTVSMVTGWYGMNFKHMPELDWPFAYPALLGFVLLVVLVEIWWFRKRKWF